MKKLILINLFMLMGTIRINGLSSEQQEQILNEIKNINKDLEDPNKAIFYLANAHVRLDGDFYGPLSESKAQQTSVNAHEKIKQILADGNQDYQQLSTAKKAIIYNCATIRRKIKNNQDAGMVKARNPHPVNTLSRIGQYDGKKYYENACPCEFYNQLSDNELKQLIEKTAPKNIFVLHQRKNIYVDKGKTSA